MKQSVNNIVKLLTIKESNILGSYADKKQKYPADVDIDSMATNVSPEYILRFFQELFKKVEDDPNIYIIDFKAGNWKTVLPLRWTSEDIKQGYQYIDSQQIRFVEALRQISKIKIDLIVIIDGVLTDINASYFLTFKNGSTNKFLSDRDPKLDLVDDLTEQLQEGNFFKALKRLYSIAKIEDDNDVKNWVLDMINSNSGKLWQTIALLENVQTMLNIDYNNKDVIEYNLKLVKDRLPNEYKKYITDNQTVNQDVISILKCELNKSIAKTISKK